MKIVKMIRYQCDFCKKAFESIYECQLHEKRYHKCLGCQYSFYDIKNNFHCLLEEKNKKCEYN